MARMYPRTLLDADVKTDSERKVFVVLRDGLPDEWEVFYSASWIYSDPVEGARDGEIDFILCRPDEPLLCLEVKGGGIDCRYGEWYRTEPGAAPERIPDPFGQALDRDWCWTTARPFERKVRLLRDRRTPPWDGATAAMRPIPGPLPAPRAWTPTTQLPRMRREYRIARQGLMRRGSSRRPRREYGVVRRAGAKVLVVMLIGGSMRVAIA